MTHVSLLDRFRPVKPTESPADRAARIDALAPDRSRVSLLMPEMSPEMKKREQRIDRREFPNESRADAVRQLLAISARESWIVALLKVTRAR